MPTVPTLEEMVSGLDPHTAANIRRVWTALESQVSNRAERFKSLVHIGANINSTLDLHTLVDTIMLKTTEVMEAERGAVFILDETTGELEFFVALGDEGKLKKIRLKKGEGIVGLVAQSGEPLVIQDAPNDPRHSKKADQATGFVTRNLLAYPLMSRQRIIGVIEVINKLPVGAPFSEDDLHLCEALSNFVAVAIQNAQTYHRAITDRLTELYNFGFFRDRLTSEVNRAREMGDTLSLIIFDVDHFKHYNDTNGHQEGNDCLVAVAGILKQAGRKGDLVARYGGEEFVTLLYGATREEAARWAEKVRHQVEATDFRGGSTQPLGRVTVSAGIASLPDDAHTDDALIVAADRRLYEAKSGGRNRVVS
ncbi:MAG: diguanylate cyclase [Candidatus Xenobia bacterium]